MILHGVYIIGIMGYILVGGLILLFMYHHLCVHFLVLVMYIQVVFISFTYFYILYAYFFVHITPSFSFYQLCDTYPRLDENLWGCMHICLPYTAICVF